MITDLIADPWLQIPKTKARRPSGFVLSKGRRHARADCSTEPAAPGVVVSTAKAAFLIRRADPWRWRTRRLTWQPMSASPFGRSWREDVLGKQRLIEPGPTLQSYQRDDKYSLRS
nr:MAG: hypothetical protein H3Rhizo37772_000002 [Mitovirus sp.]